MSDRSWIRQAAASVLMVFAVLIITMNCNSGNGGNGGCPTCPNPIEYKIVGITAPVNGLTLKQGEPVPCSWFTIEPSTGTQGAIYLNAVHSHPRLACPDEVDGFFKVLSYATIPGGAVFLPPVGTHAVLFVALRLDPSKPVEEREVLKVEERTIHVVP